MQNEAENMTLLVHHSCSLDRLRRPAAPAFALQHPIELVARLVLGMVQRDRPETECFGESRDRDRSFVRLNVGLLGSCSVGRVGDGAGGSGMLHECHGD